ncbi:MAG TPA: site-specific DNA-methyltransferase [Solimonas sp.]|nr:site-specific DNA-methyltransferase [Solimonas sp.]
MSFDVLLGDCVQKMRTLPENSIDSVVTDPPYGLEFMGKDWDGANGFRRSLNANDADRDSVLGRMSKRGPEYRAGALFQDWCELWAREALRVLKPGGHLLAFSGARTYHRLACAIEDAGFEIRDQVMWVYGSGFPKSKNLADEWSGWGTALKPAHEPICVARKPLIGTVAANVLEHGTGALNIDACRVGYEVRTASFSSFAACHGNRLGAPGTSEARRGTQGEPQQYVGRWPANLIHDGSDEVLAAFPQAPGQQRPVGPANGAKPSVNVYGDYGPREQCDPRGDKGSAARFFYCAKASKSDRGEGNAHPTVKPTELMRYLCRLVTPPGGLVLDPFTGSGSTGKAALLEGFRFLGIEQDIEYALLAHSRIASAIST